MLLLLLRHLMFSTISWQHTHLHSSHACLLNTHFLLLLLLLLLLVLVAAVKFWVLLLLLLQTAQLVSAATSIFLLALLTLLLTGCGLVHLLLLNQQLLSATLLAT
jgi:hypothetical protein